MTRILKSLCIAALAGTFGAGAQAATLTNGFTIGDGVTEGSNQNRRTVVGTDDKNIDAGTIDMGTLGVGDVFGIYGRIVSAVDLFAFEFTTVGAFEIAFDLDGYDVYKTGDSDPGDGSNIETVSLSGLVTQGDIPGESNGNSTADKEVKFSLFKNGTLQSDTFRTSNIVDGASEAERVLFTGDAAATYLLRIDGAGGPNTPNDNGIAALYDINITATPVPLPAGAVLMLSGLAGLGVMRRRRTRG
jgi:hypothetical protein